MDSFSPTFWRKKVDIDKKRICYSGRNAPLLNSNHLYLSWHISLWNDPDVIQTVKTKQRKSFLLSLVYHFIGIGTIFRCRQETLQTASLQIVFAVHFSLHIFILNLYPYTALNSHDKCFFILFYFCILVAVELQ